VERHPCSSEDLDQLEQEGVQALISLCAAEEIKLSGRNSPKRYRVGSPYRCQITTTIASHGPADLWVL